MVNDKDVSMGFERLSGSDLVFFGILVVQNFKVVSSIIGRICQLQVKCLNELRRELRANHLYSVELIKGSGLWGKMIDGVVRDCDKRSTVCFHVVDYIKQRE